MTDRTVSKQRLAKQSQSLRARKRRQSRTRLIIGAAVVVVGLFLLVLLLSVLPERARLVQTSYDGFVQSEVTGETGIAFAIGNPDAPVTLVEFSDFSCSHCHDLSRIIDQVIQEYVASGEVRVVYKPVAFVYPPASVPAAQAAICAGRQGKFWQMAAQIWGLYESGGPTAYTPRALAARAELLELDMDEYRACVDAPETLEAVQSVILETQERGITGTPAIYINGEPFVYQVNTDITDFRVAIEALLGS